MKFAEIQKQINILKDFFLDRFCRFRGEKHLLNTKVTAHHLLWVFIILGAVFCYYITSFTTSRVDGQSMYPTLKNEEFLLVQKYIFFRKPNRGDIISAMLDKVHNKDTKGTTVVKRVIGLPGEIVEFKNRRFQIINPDDGYIKFEEEYLPDKYLTPSWDGEEKRFLVPKNEYFVLGDNREISEDSRNYGTIPFSNMVGKVIYKIPAVYQIKAPKYEFDVKPLDQVMSENLFKREQAELEKIKKEQEEIEQAELEIAEELEKKMAESSLGSNADSLGSTSVSGEEIASSSEM